MSISNSETRIWKERYTKISAELELAEEALEKNTLVFRRVITRLARAATGFDGRLDPHLMYLRKAFKENNDLQAFADISAIFAEKLLHYEDDSDENFIEDAGLLFDFLISKESNNNKIRALILLREQYEMGELSGAPELIKLLTVLSIRADSIDENGEISHLSGANLDISKQLIDLLKGDDMSDISKEQAENVVKILQNDHEGNFYENIGAALVLLQSIKKQDELEKKAMDSFLTNVTQRLVILAKNTKGATEFIGKLTNKRENLDQDVVKKIDSLKEHIDTETKIESLKSIMQSELEIIGTRIKSYQKDVDGEQSETDKRLVLMSSEIELMRTKTESLKASLKRVTKQAQTDVLTQLPNRLAYDQRLANDLASWKRYETSFCLLIWDIDFFKNINDEYGHKAGDKVLAMIAKVLKRYCRDVDFISRFGGEEFVMLLSSISEDNALDVANKTRKVIEKLGFNSSGRSIRITISCGIAEVIKDDDKDSLFERADKALYRAKSYGRNQCIIGH